jgi:predicted TIM-barrel fold metal-dependent hydrolase
VSGGTEGENPLVDAHFHLWTPDLPLTDTAWHRPPTDGSTERFLGIMDAHGILFGVVAAASPHGTYNDYVRAALRRYKRLRATATVDPDTSIYELERMRDDGFVGIRFVFSVRDDVPDLTAEPYRRLLRRVADLDWHVHITDKPHRLAHTIEAVQRSGAKLVIDHMGHVELPDGVNSPAFQSVLRAVDNRRTWVKISAGFRFSAPDVAKMYAQELVRVVGGERLLWASDWPFAAYEEKVTYADCLAAFRDWVPDARLRRQIGGETPLRLYFT